MRGRTFSWSGSVSAYDGAGSGRSALDMRGWAAEDGQEAGQARFLAEVQ